ncbi:MAG: hypothetical protein LAT63_02020 [Marinobacter sp.]|nr:hypothetical protein [Marinobacter sp.]
MALKTTLPALAWLLLTAIASVQAHAGTPQPRQSFETCSLITSEYITVLQLLYRGFSGDALEQSLPGLSDAGRTRLQGLVQTVSEEGLLATYSTVNSEYARCGSRVYRQSGMPRPHSREAAFHYCAGENKVRYEILLALMVGGQVEEISNQLLPHYAQIVVALDELYRNQGALAAFDALASELKFCLNEIP